MPSQRDRAQSLLTATPTPAVVAEIRQLVAEARAAVPPGSSIGELSERQAAALHAYGEAYHSFRGKQFEALKAFGLISTV